MMKIQNIFKKIISYYKRNPHYIILQVIGLVFALILTNMYINYSKTVEWEKYSGLTIAEQEPFMLYLSDEEKTQLKKYTYLENKIYDKTINSFKANVEDSDIKQLKEAFEQMPEELQNRVFNVYTMITDLWESQNDFKKMFNSQNQIKSSVTPYSVSEYMKKHGNILSKYLESKTYNSVALQLYEDISKLIIDVNRVGIVIDSINKNYSIDGKHLLLNKDVISDDFAKANNEISELQYDWEIVQNVFIPAYRNSKEYLTKHEEAKAEYDALEELKKEKENFEKWVKEYNAFKKDLVEYKDFTNKDKRDVEEWAKENKLKVNYKYINSAFVKKDKIISQKPVKKDFTHIHKDVTIDVVVSKGRLFNEDNR